MKTITTISDYCRHVNIPQPKYAFFDIRRFENKTKTENAKQAPFRHEFYAIAVRHAGENNQVNGQPLLNNLSFNSPHRETRLIRNGNLLVGLGMATALYPTYLSPSAASAKSGVDGRAEIRTGGHEHGTGTYTIFTQIAADALGLPLKRVTVK